MNKTATLWAIENDRPAEWKCEIVGEFGGDVVYRREVFGHHKDTLKPKRGWQYFTCTGDLGVRETPEDTWAWLRKRKAFRVFIAEHEADCINAQAQAEELPTEEAPDDEVAD